METTSFNAMEKKFDKFLYVKCYSWNNECKSVKYNLY